MKSLEDLKEKTNNISDSVGQKAKESVEKGSEDWLQYIKAHPFQSMLYGAVIFLAFRGLLKS
jgi:ElaB/YqjD/DUF883 family membrane-anchored ribosome-binding protein